MQKGLVSVIVPAYNVENNISYCIDSLLKQTYTNIEILCIDDGSKDGTYEAIKAYVQKDSRVKAFTKENGGVSSTRNYGLDLAQGEYISFVDSDDFVDSRFYEKLTQLILGYDADIARCRGRGVKSYDYKEPAPENGINIAVRNTQEAIDIFYDGQFYGWYADNASVIWNCLYKADVLKTIRFNTELSNGEDDCFIQQAICESKKTVYSDERLYFYYYNESGLCHKKLDDGKRLSNIIAIYTEQQQYFKNKGFNSVMQKNAKFACDNICEIYCDLKNTIAKKNARKAFNSFYKIADGKTKALKIFKISPFLYKLAVKFVFKK